MAKYVLLEIEINLRVEQGSIPNVSFQNLDIAQFELQLCLFLTAKPRRVDRLLQQYYRPW